MKDKILIAVPTFENIKPECFKSIYNLRNPKDYLLYFDYVKGYDCARARNEIAKLAIKYGFDFVLMIDSDVNVPRQTINNLLECETDIALGWYYKKRTTTDQTVIFDFGKDYTDKNMIYGKLTIPLTLKAVALESLSLMLMSSGKCHIHISNTLSMAMTQYCQRTCISAQKPENTE